MEIKIINTGVLQVNTLIVKLTEHSAFVVDPASCEYSDDADVIVSELKNLRLTPIGIFLTHGHFDHIMGLKILKNEWPDAIIAIHKNDEQCIGKNSAQTQLKFLSSFGYHDQNFVDSLSELPPADFLLTEGITFDKVISSKEKKIQRALSQWKVIHTPGHTSGSVCFYNQEEKILITGDTMFFTSYGRTDMYDGNEEEIQKSIFRILNTFEHDTQIFPGHDYYGFKLSEYSPL